MSVRGRVHTGLAAASTALLALTLALPDWIEAVFGVDPDTRSGGLELALCAAFAAAAIVFGVRARAAAAA